MKIVIVFGTRPEAIKMCVLVNKLKKNSNFQVVCCVTGQHREMLDSVLNTFNVIPDYDLNIMIKNQSLSYITKSILEKFDTILNIEKPNLVLIHGDTTTALAAGMSAFYNKIPIGHVEAGLRTYDINLPYPEEFNRRLISVFSNIHFSPTEENKNNLIKEGISEDNIYITGNTVIDSLKEVVKNNYLFKNNFLNKIDYKSKKIILITIHRRENLNMNLINILNAIKEIALEYRDIIIIFPVHKNPLLRENVYKIIGGIDNINLIEPLEYDDFSNLISKSYFVVTDSGGIQEEAPALKKPVLVVREETERKEAVIAGTVKIVGTSKENIKENIVYLLKNSIEYKRMANSKNPYGDGKSSDKIIEILLEKFKG